MKPHGVVELCWRENVLMIETQGPFNVEGISIAFQQIKQSVEQYKTELWLRIDILDHDTLGCPNVMKVIGDSYKWSLTNGCLEVAVVCKNQLQLDLLTKFTDHTGLNIKAFKSKVQAIQYLQ